MFKAGKSQHYVVRVWQIRFCELVSARDNIPALTQPKIGPNL
jgi:hypothetical protein